MAEILRAASTELVDAAAWYDDRVSGLGERFLIDSQNVFARIDATPLTGAPWIHRRLPEGIRRMFLRSFPYSVVYVVAPRLVIVAVAHLRRRPDYWAKRPSEL